MLPPSCADSFFRRYRILSMMTIPITNVASDSYTLDWNCKTITVTAYAETKAQNKLIDEYIENSALKFKRLIHKI